jgi:cytochrome c peroxidase
MAVTSKEEDRGRFKTPTLREVAHTFPYMHDGSKATLEEVVS